MTALELQAQLRQLHCERHLTALTGLANAPGYAADLEELRVHLGLPRMDLLGFSHGAVVGVHYAARYPNGVARLVLASGLAAFTDESKAFAEGRR